MTYSSTNGQRLKTTPLGGGVEAHSALEIDDHLDHLVTLRSQEVALLAALSAVRGEKGAILRALQGESPNKTTQRSPAGILPAAPRPSSTLDGSPPSTWVWPGGMRPPAPLTPLLRATLAALDSGQMLSAREVAQIRFGEDKGRDGSIASRVKRSLDQLVEQGWAVRFSRGQYQRSAGMEPDSSHESNPVLLGSSTPSVSNFPPPTPEVSR